MQLLVAVDRGLKSETAINLLARVGIGRCISNGSRRATHQYPRETYWKYQNYGVWH